MEKSGQHYGITQVKFSKDGHLLYTSQRNCNELKVYDIRNSSIPFDIIRNNNTNQRCYFDVDNILCFGDTDGNVSLYDQKVTRQFKGDGVVSSVGIGNDCIAACFGSRQFMFDDCFESYINIYNI